MATPVWQPGTLYSPGALVRPRSAPAVDVGQPDNAGFEAGNVTGWTVASEVGGDGSFAANNAHWLSGTWCGKWNGGAGGGSEGGIEGYIVSTEKAAVNPGQTITGKCYILYNTAGHQAGSRGQVLIAWYDASEAFISYSRGTVIAGRGNNGRWVLSTVVGTAPSNAEFASIGVWMTVRFGDIYVDDFSWDYAYSGPPDGLIFRATQADAGFSGNNEPTWPTTVGATVVDNEVTWEGVLTSRVVWEAEPILVSGATEPDFPTLVGGTVVDNTIAWRAVSRRIEDERCPNSKVVAIAASKIFAADDDIIAFSATVNPLDWSTPDDAGYIPFGLNTYGSNPVTALGLYRGNLIAFNSEAFQMWQVDQDPANMAILDAVPVSCTYPQSVQSVANDLVFCNPVGVRNINIAGASTNLQAGQFGEAVDPLVTAKLKAAEFEPLGLYYPAQGQYWLFFGDEAFVLTINGTKDQSWSRYVFPEEITDWTLHGDQLYLRTSTGKVWHVTEDALQDDMYSVGNPPVLTGEANIGNNELTWTVVDPEGTGTIVSYSLERALGNGAYAVVATVDAEDPLEFTESIESPEIYHYRVRALNEFNSYTGYSNVVDLDPAGFGNNVLLLQYNSGVQIESTSVPHIDQVIGVSSGSGISTAQAKFDTHSYFNENQAVDNTNYVQCWDEVALTRFVFTGLFTMEGWFWRDTDGGGEMSTLFANNKTPGAGYFFLGPIWNSTGFGDEPANSLVFQYNSSEVSLSDLIMGYDQWIHIAITRDEDDVVRVFLNGVPSAVQPTISGAFGGTSTEAPNPLATYFTICEGVPFVSADFDGYFDQIRVSRGVCRYREAFTPPTAPFEVE